MSNTTSYAFKETNSLFDDSDDDIPIVEGKHNNKTEKQYVWRSNVKITAMPKNSVIIKTMQQFNFAVVNSVSIPHEEPYTSSLAFVTSGPEMFFVSQVLNDTNLEKIGVLIPKKILEEILDEYIMTNGSWDAMVTVLRHEHKDNQATLPVRVYTYAIPKWEVNLAPMGEKPFTSFRQTLGVDCGAPYFDLKKGDNGELYDSKFKKSAKLSKFKALTLNELQIFLSKVSTKEGLRSLFSDELFVPRTVMKLKVKKELRLKTKVNEKVRMYGVAPLGAGYALSLVFSHFYDGLKKFPLSPVALGFTYAHGGGSQLADYVFTTPRGSSRYLLYADDLYIIVHTKDGTIYVSGPDISHMDGSITFTAVTQLAKFMYGKFSQVDVYPGWLNTIAAMPYLAIRSPFVMNGSTVYCRSRDRLLSGIPGTSIIDSFCTSSMMEQATVDGLFDGLTDNDILEDDSVFAKFRLLASKYGFTLKESTLKWERVATEGKEESLIRTTFLGMSLERIGDEWYPVKLPKEQEKVWASLFFASKHMKEQSERNGLLALGAIGKVSTHYPDDTSYKLAKSIWDIARKDEFSLASNYQALDIPVELGDNELYNAFITSCFDLKTHLPLPFPPKEKIKAIYMKDTQSVFFRPFTTSTNWADIDDDEVSRSMNLKDVELGLESLIVTPSVPINPDKVVVEEASRDRPNLPPLLPKILRAEQKELYESRYKKIPRSLYVDDGERKEAKNKRDKRLQFNASQRDKKGGFRVARYVEEQHDFIAEAKKQVPPQFTRAHLRDLQKRKKELEEVLDLEDSVTAAEGIALIILLEEEISAIEDYRRELQSINNEASDLQNLVGGLKGGLDMTPLCYDCPNPDDYFCVGYEDAADMISYSREVEPSRGWRRLFSLWLYRYVTMVEYITDITPIDTRMTNPTSWSDYADYIYCSIGIREDDRRCFCGFHLIQYPACPRCEQKHDNTLRICARLVEIAGLWSSEIDESTLDHPVCVKCDNKHNPALRCEWLYPPLGDEQFECKACGGEHHSRLPCFIMDPMHYQCLECGAFHPSDIEQAECFKKNQLRQQPSSGLSDEKSILTTEIMNATNFMDHFLPNVPNPLDLSGDIDPMCMVCHTRHSVVRVCGSLPGGMNHEEKKLISAALKGAKIKQAKKTPRVKNSKRIAKERRKTPKYIGAVDLTAKVGAIYAASLGDPFDIVPPPLGFGHFGVGITHATAYARGTFALDGSTKKDACLVFNPWACCNPYSGAITTDCVKPFVAQMSLASSASVWLAAGNCTGVPATNCTQISSLTTTGNPGMRLLSAGVRLRVTYPMTDRKSVV